MSRLFAVPLFDPASLSSAGSLVSLLASAAGMSRAGLIEATGLSRVTITQRLNALLAARLVREGGDTVPSGGRPTRLLGLCDEAGVILAADLGERQVRLALTDLSPAIRRQETIDFRPEDGPEPTMRRIADGFERLLAGEGSFVAGIGISLPAPVDHRAGIVVGPSILKGWDDFPVAGWIEERFGAPALAENDVNLMTVYEHRERGRLEDDFLFVKLGTGIGSGIMAEGRLYRGARGAAGDIGHIQFFGDGPAPLCRCGKRGCLEARAAGWALARDLRDLGFAAEDARDVVALVDRGVPEAIALVQSAGRAVGEALSDVISVLNPGEIVIGGTLARASSHLMAGIRDLVRERCLPLATRDLVLTSAPTLDQACLIGTAIRVREHIFAPGGVDRFLAGYGRWFADRGG